MAEHVPRPRLLVPLALFAAVTAVSLAASLFKQAAPTHPLAMAGIRLLIAGVLLSPWAVLAWRQGTLRGPMLVWAALAGVAYGVHFGAWVSSLTLTSVAASVTLVTITPVILACLGLITGKDRPTRRLWFAMGLAALGVALIGSQHSLSQPGALLGDALAVVGAVAIAAYFVISRNAGQHLPVWAYQSVACLVGAVLLLATGAAAGIELRPASTTSLTFILLSALIPQLIGHSLLTWALRHATPTQVSMAVVGEPAGATIIAWLWLGDTVAPVIAVGCGITLAAVVVASRLR
jgi:drug/metabolite transporter (DMT)-like permease